MNIYQTDDDGVWDGQVRQARENPMQPGEFLIPRGCVTEDPPTVGQNEAAQFVSGAWTVVPDFRGRVYWKVDRTMQTIQVVGEQVPSGALDADPGPSLEDIRTSLLATCDAMLSEIDAKSQRSVREVTLALFSGAPPTAEAAAQLKQHNADAEVLRVKRAAIVAAVAREQLDAVQLL